MSIPKSIQCMPSLPWIVVTQSSFLFVHSTVCDIRLELKIHHRQNVTFRVYSPLSSLYTVPNPSLSKLNPQYQQLTSVKHHRTSRRPHVRIPRGLPFLWSYSSRGQALLAKLHGPTALDPIRTQPLSSLHPLSPPSLPPFVSGVPDLNKS